MILRRRLFVISPCGADGEWGDPACGTQPEYPRWALGADRPSSPGNCSSRVVELSRWRAHGRAGWVGYVSAVENVSSTAPEPGKPHRYRTSHRERAPRLARCVGLSLCRPD